MRAVSGAGQLLEEPYLDLTEQVGFGGERGLLSVAFHPEFQANRFLYASFTDNGGTSLIIRYTESPDGDSADPGSAVEILAQSQPFGNHNGGHLAFGPDGYLYFGFGDGGSGGDPLNSGQDTETWLGSMLRIDIDSPSGGLNYGVPGDNPFLNDPTGRDEIWSYGLRNPWRFSFDAQDNRLYIGDVGQNDQEEVSVVTVEPAGYNFGWRVKEGELCFGQTPCDDPGFTDPALVYANPGQGCSVTGGYVDRGSAIPELDGTYLYSDFCSGWIKGFRLVDGEAQDRRTWIDDVGNVTSFGVDNQGEIYVLTSQGEVLQIIRQ